MFEGDKWQSKWSFNSLKMSNSIIIIIMIMMGELNMDAVVRKRAVRRQLEVEHDFDHAPFESWSAASSESTIG